MNKEEYFRKMIREEIPRNNEWIFRTFATIVDELPDKYATRSGDKLFVDIDGTQTQLTGAKVGEPIFSPDTLIEMTKEDMDIIDKPITTTLMIAIVNLLINKIALKGKIKYINGEVSFSLIEDLMIDKLSDLPEDGEPRREDLFYYDDRLNLSAMRSRIREWAVLFTVAKSEVSAEKPPNLEKFKAELLERMTKKYKSTLWSSPLHAVEFENELLAFDDKFISGGSSHGIVMSKKIIGKSRKDRFLTLGYQRNQFDPEQPAKMIVGSLSNGIELTRKEFPLHVNELRAGSIVRGVQTQQSGSTAKDLVMATMGLKYIGGDCSTDRYLDITVTERGHRYTGMYMMVKGKPKLIENGKDILNVPIKLRRPRFCNSPVSEFCEICGGSGTVGNETGIVLQSTAFGGTMLNLDMKKTHGKVTQTLVIEF